MDVQTKVEAYLHEIEDHVIEPIESWGIHKSCVATMMLIFAAIDGLGKLSHPAQNASPGARFRFFLAKLGINYDERYCEIWGLRNALMHNALNVEVFLSKTELGAEHHLELVQLPGRIYINTKRFFEDFLIAFERERDNLRFDTAAASVAETRLIWCEDDEKVLLGYPTTPPPLVQFVINR